MNTNKQPLVSVILPAYNAGEFIVESIESILNQTYKNFEFIIVDDASTDNTWKIISEYKSKYPKIIKAIHLKKNLGKGGEAAGNVAFNKAKGEFIARMDADDIAVPTRIEKQVSFLLNNKEVSLVGSNATIINEKGYVSGVKKVPSKHADIYKEYFVIHPLIHPTIMIRRSALKGRKYLYRGDLPSNNDYITFIELISKGAKYANIAESLLMYRIHSKNDSLLRVKKTFRRSLITRYKAVMEFGYKPSLVSILKLIAQIALIYTLPDKAIYTLYTYIRGMRQPIISTSSFGRLKVAKHIA